MIGNMGNKKGSRDLGKWGEGVAKSYLIERGFEVIVQNYYTEYGEIDLVALRDDRIHFVEVKTRRTQIFGNPEESITIRKLSHMVDSAQAYLLTHPEFEGDWQIDVISIQLFEGDRPPEIRFFENAS
jgi:putative endonuclease